ncbi:MAG: hypothetical protein O2829_07870 [Bacteroidetes bacterium]|nr:hypothetical protein [Bacteroidota bacterium]
MKSTVSLILALFLLFSTIGMAKTTHWCMGHEVDSSIGFGEKHLDCGMELPASEEEESQSTTEDPSSCCENKTQHLQVEDDFQISQYDLQINLNYTLSFLQVFVFGVDFFTISQVDFPAKSAPPSPKRDFQLLYQTFLI